MAGTRRKFSEEFKREAVSLSYSSGKTIDEVANDLGYPSSGTASRLTTVPSQ